MCWLCGLCCPCWLWWLGFGCMAPCGWAGCWGADGGAGCWTWGCGWVAPWGGMTPVAMKNWLMEEHRSAIWAASRDQLLSSACRMLSFRPDRERKQSAVTATHQSFYCFKMWHRFMYFILLFWFVFCKLMHELLICICSACSARQEKNKQRKNRKRSDIRENLLLN